MDTEKLVVKDTAEWQYIEKIHDSIVNLLIILVDALINRKIHSARKLKYDVS